jgi:hypothetical protein
MPPELDKSKYAGTITGQDGKPQMVQKYHPEDAHHDKFQKLLDVAKKDKELDSIAYTFGISGQDSTKGHFSKVSQEFLDSIGGAAHIRSRILERMKSKTPISIELKAIYNSILTGEKFYLVDSSEGEAF